MIKTRIIPVLLLHNKGLVKTVKFKNPVYVGDPFNAVKIFNEKEVDELIFLDIESSKLGKPIDFKRIEEIAAETFMPFAYGGGISTIDDVRRILKSGAEKIVMNTNAVNNFGFIKTVSDEYGAQSVVVSIDTHKNIFGRYEIFVKSGTDKIKLDLLEYVHRLEEAGAGEIFINSIDNDGVMKGYDLDLISMVAHNCTVPIVACGGAGLLEDLRKAVDAGASAVAAGSLFVFYGKHKAVLITYPSSNEIQQLFS